MYVDELYQNIENQMLQHNDYEQIGVIILLHEDVHILVKNIGVEQTVIPQKLRHSLVQQNQTIQYGIQ
jgi:hypothetical protein